MIQSPRRKKGPRLLLVVIVLLCILGFFLYEWHRFNIKLAPITDRDVATFTALANLLQATARYPYPSRPVDDRSLGFPQKEAQLQLLDQPVSLFEGRFHRLPTSLNELPMVIEEGPRAKTARQELQELASSCQILLLGAESYVLNCDDWNPHGKVSWDIVLGSPRLDSVKFLLADGHVLLFAPPPTKSGLKN